MLRGGGMTHLFFSRSSENSRKIFFNKPKKKESSKKKGLPLFQEEPPILQKSHHSKESFDFLDAKPFWTFVETGGAISSSTSSHPIFDIPNSISTSETSNPKEFFFGAGPVFLVSGITTVFGGLYVGSISTK
mmetsp:Transcript_38789/g.54084  ORF Transcript_38789/g.54084 Transcript_38789/m.54084 type:complete len:132 (+) Transcript_38789:73-468(+)